ncbi:hypothetical protein CPB97_007729 [Podila verticillata]|nr:hypothetical protein CPB97_007729 [Podila verticillata]
MESKVSLDLISRSTLNLGHGHSTTQHLVPSIKFENKLRFHYANRPCQNNRAIYLESNIKFLRLMHLTTHISKSAYSNYVPQNREAIRQWDVSEPENGLTTPLGQWTAANMQLTSRYHSTLKIASKFESCGRDEDRMWIKYGDKLVGLVCELLKAIRKKRSREIKRTEKQKQKQEVTVSATHVVEESEEEQEPLEHDTETNAPVPRIPDIVHWKDEIHQWDLGDPEYGLTLPLGRWTPAMAQGNKTYHNRRTIARVFDFYGRDEDEMRREYDNGMNGSARKLMKAMNWRHLRVKKRVYEFEFCGRDGNTVRKLHGKNMDNISHLMLSIRWRKRLKKQGKTTLMKALEENEDELLDKNDQEEPFSEKHKAATADDT